MFTLLTSIRRSMSSVCTCCGDATRWGRAARRPASAAPAHATSAAHATSTTTTLRPGFIRPPPCTCGPGSEARPHTEADEARVAVEGRVVLGELVGTQAVLSLELSVVEVRPAIVGIEPVRRLGGARRGVDGVHVLRVEQVQHPKEDADARPRDR